MSCNFTVICHANGCCESSLKMDSQLKGELVCKLADASILAIKSVDDAKHLELHQKCVRFLCHKRTLRMPLARWQGSLLL
jgi:hypothetical protein